MLLGMLPTARQVLQQSQKSKHSEMSKRALIWIVSGWVMLTLFNYYYMNFFFLAIELLGLVLALFVIVIVQLIKLIREGSKVSRLRIQKVFVFGFMLVSTLFNLINPLIEKIDWVIFYNTRNDIVQKVTEKKLNPNVSWNGWVCELPFEFPVISNGGNDIGIYRNDKTDKLTVTFWVFRNFFDSPSTQFIYTTDTDQIKAIEERIKSEPENNWKIEANWYRTYGE